MLLIILFLLISTIIFNPSYAFDKTRESNLSGTDESNVAKRENPKESSQDFEIRRVNVVSNVSETENRDLSQNLSSNNHSDVVTFELPSFQSKSNNSCDTPTCRLNFSTGWNDKTSIQFSTNSTNDDTSKIIGKEVDVKPRESIHLVIHMKLNKWVSNPRVELSGFNGTSKEWYYIDNCPTFALTEQMDWQEFNCGFTIEGNTTKVRPVLASGWSSEPKEEAITWFDSISLIKFKPFIADSNLNTQIVYQGLEEPVSMAFLGPNDFLVTEKDGNVMRIVNDIKLAKPVLHVDVVGDGLLGIALDKNGNMTGTGTNKQTTYVFLYFIEPGENDADGSHNRLYRYQFLNNSLVNPKLLLDLPAGFEHNGGPILIDHDNYIYTMIGELDGKTIIPHIKNRALNYKGNDTKQADGRGGILKIDQNGNPKTPGILSNKEPLNKYYAYGIRNSFGMDIDPVTGKLWDTENGPAFGDEINLVEPGFNSGWNKV
jgi:glucose/sorbosone dehydrogenase